MQDPSDLQRNQIINQVYDVVLHPEKTGDFVAAWEGYITELSAKYDDRANATGFSDVVINDDGLETHFARAYAILERLGRTHEAGTTATDGKHAGYLACCDITGKVTALSAAGHDLFGAITTAADLMPFLQVESATAWEAFVHTTGRAPSIGNLRIFSLAHGGNLVAFNQRDDQTGDVRIVLRSLTVAWSPRLVTLLTDHFNLTKRELAIVQQLARHGSLDAIAQASIRSKNTLRAQMKAVFAKMNVTSQPGVLQSVAMLSHFASFTGYEAPGDVNTPLLGEVQMIRIKGDVVIPVHFIGPEDGTPVIFIHGMLDGVAVTQPILKALHKHNLRLIAPIRASFGTAAPLADVNAAPAIFAKQLRGLLQALDLDRTFLLGHMSGALFAFAAAPALNGKVAGIINISGGVPILSTRQFAQMAMRQKAYAYTTRYAPAILPTLLRVGVAQIDSMGINTLMMDMYRAGSPDRAVLSDARIAAVVLDGYRFAVKQGYRGFEGDAYQVTRNWSEYVNATTCPVHLIHGHHDPAVTIASVQNFAHTQGYALSEYPEDGQLILYHKPNAVLGDVRRFIDSLPQ